LVGRRARLIPAGENTSLDQQLPQTGTFSKQVALRDWGHDWLILRFDYPFTYDGYEVRLCLVRARWHGCPIGSEFCPVFVLFDNTDRLGATTEYQSSDFHFVSWGEIEVDAV
jgi:hypothetical protein